jgi:arylsulfatase B
MVLKDLVVVTVVGSAAATNFIFILADDMGWGDPHYNGGTALTPHLDAIAASKHAVVLNRFYAENVCSPSRASIMTGRVPDRACIWTGS